MSALILIGMAQCKKKNELVTNGGNIPASGTISIKLKVSDDGSKVIVDPNTGAVGFTAGDIVYATYNGVCVGTLEHNGNEFNGEIPGSLEEGSSLVFYFLGNMTPNETVSGATSLSVSIFDQTKGYPVISAGVAKELYSPATTEYTAKLNNHCALVKFDVSTSSETPTIITGVKDQVTVTFAVNKVGAFENSMYRGAVKVAGGTGERWAILLPQDATGVDVAYSEDLRYNGTRGTMPIIVDNGYLTDGITVTVSNELSGFSVSENDVVFFSHGNLQYIGSAATPYWQFAADPTKMIPQDNGQLTSGEHIDRDLFPWGTSGYNGRYPYSVGQNDSWYAEGLTTNISGTNYDWGYYNSNNIINGYNRSWRTPTKDELAYVLNTRNTTSGIRYAKATINDMGGVILLPNNWNELNYTLNNTNTADVAFSTNVITLDQWTKYLEANGAIFLASGGYIGYNALHINNNVMHYWTATSLPYNEGAYYTYANNNTLLAAYDYDDYRSLSYAVRLITSAN